MEKEYIREQIKNKTSGYIHFDKRRSLDDVLWNYISNPENVKHHGFFPFIHFTQNTIKVKGQDDKEQLKFKEKRRDIMYAAHVDSWIYRYYGAYLNEKYNEYLDIQGLHNIPIAYRTNLDGQCNINYAEDAFTFIKSNLPNLVIIGDFTKFFDFIDHQYLKRQLCELLEVDLLPSDFYHVFSSLTKYSYVDLSTVLEYRQVNSLKELNSEKLILSLSDFHKLSRKKHRNNRDDNFIIKRNQKPFGIPQGSPMSGVLANIYMLNYDKILFEWVKKRHGYYRRYCDDFIIVLPCAVGKEEFVEKEAREWLKKLFSRRCTKSGKLFVKLQTEKTQVYFFDGEQIKDCCSSKKTPYISFLGFSYNGQFVKIRDQTTSRYYHRFYRKLREIQKQNDLKHRYGEKLHGCSNFYKLYTEKGKFDIDKNGDRKGNFIDYARRSSKIFDINFRDHHKINLIPQRHMHKAKKELKKIYKKQALHGNLGDE